MRAGGRVSEHVARERDLLSREIRNNGNGTVESVNDGKARRDHRGRSAGKRAERGERDGKGETKAQRGILILGRHYGDF